MFEKDLFVINAVDTMRGCKHPIVADLRDFVSFSKRNILRKRYCKANKVDQFAHHIFPPEFRCIWNPRECFPPLVVLQQSKGTQIPGEENEGSRKANICHRILGKLSYKKTVKKADIVCFGQPPPPKRVKSGHLLSDYRQKCVNGTRDILMLKLR